MFGFIYIYLVITGLFLTQGNPLKKNDVIITDQFPLVVEEMWPMVAGIDQIIESQDLLEFFTRYTPSQENSVEEVDFIGGEESWTKDFADLFMTEEFSSAYFRVLDILLVRLTQPLLNLGDMDRMVFVCEAHSGTSSDGFISEEEFKSGYSEVILRGISFSLLFIRYKGTYEPLQQFENLNMTHFRKIFYDMDANDNGNVTAEEFAFFWEHGMYGYTDMAIELFGRLDINGYGFLDLEDWDYLFRDLDCRDAIDADRENEEMDIEEILQLDLILHGDRSYPSSECALQKPV